MTSVVQLTRDPFNDVSVTQFLELVQKYRDETLGFMLETKDDAKTIQWREQIRAIDRILSIPQEIRNKINASRDGHRHEDADI